ncbi:hypothetical protein KKE60_05850, partial [Patescibacteria group bacterium]|nr:hypothetical protein [Patescibacteria group bacterium]
MRVKQQKIKMYLEGIEFSNLNSITINEQIGAPPSCEVVVGFSSRITDLLPKTQCHIFYWHNDKYVLIFMGELTATSFDKGATQRMCKLQFTALSLNWRNHYLLSDNLKLKLFDEGAFLVLNSKMPYGASKTEISSALEAGGAYGVPDYSDEKYEKVKDKFTKKIIVNGQQSNQSILSILKSSPDCHFPEDLFFAMMCVESPGGYNETFGEDRDTIFAFNGKNYNTKTGETATYNLAKLTELDSHKAGTLSDTHIYANLTKKDYKEAPFDPFACTAWGALQVMGRFMFIDRGLSLVECARVINGILYKKHVYIGKSVNDYKIFKDEISGKYYEIPSVEYLTYLQCKAAYALLLDKNPKFSPDNPYKTTDPRRMMGDWMSKKCPLNAPYVVEMNKYFVKYRREQAISNDVATNDKAEENTQVKDFYEDISSPEWLQFILKGGAITGLVENKIAQALEKQNLSDIIANIMQVVANQSIYCNLLYKAGGLNENRVYTFDNEPAESLMKLKGITNLILNHATQYMTRTTSAMELIKV